MERHSPPPRWIRLLLQRFADESTLEEVEGDLLEFYPLWVADFGRGRANLKFLWTVVTLLRPFRLKKGPKRSTTAMHMIANFLVLGWRSILKNKVSTFINVSGLALGLTTCLLIVLVILQEFEYDRQHEKSESIFLMMKNQRTNDGISTGRSTMGPLAAELKAVNSHVVHAARVTWFGGTRLVAAGKRTDASGIYTDADLFRMMTFRNRKGDAVAALDRRQLVVSRSEAIRLFGTEEVIGQAVQLGRVTLEVGAVIDDVPAASSVRFDIAAPFAVFEKENPWLNKWDDNRIQTWIELHAPADLDAFNASVESLLSEKTKDPNEALFAYPLTRLHLYGWFSNGQPSGGIITVLWILAGFGSFVLLIACVNFMNLATAQAARRAREVGVRKVLGSLRKWIMVQFLNEALIVTLLAFGLAVVVTALVVPSFNRLLHASVSLDLTNGKVWATYFALAIVTALVAGSYPAFVLSRFQPARVLKGMIDQPGGSSLRRALVTFQFVISISVLIGTIILSAQSEYVRNRPLGYQQEKLIHVPLDSMATARFEIIKDELSGLPGVRSVTGTEDNILYANGSVTGMDWPGRKPGEDISVAIAGAAYGWSKTLGIELVQGRDFDPRFASDAGACLLNESAANKMGLVHPIGSVVGGHEVIGIFKDFVYNNPAGSIEPMAVYLKNTSIHHLYARIDNDNSWRNTIQSIEAIVKGISPEMDFDVRFTSDEFQSRFQEIADVGHMVRIFGGMTIFISCLGLFGLSGFVAERRAKEMSIRRVFGASHWGVLWALSSDVVRPVVVALAIVLPISIWLAGVALDEFVYRVPLSWWMFAQATAIVAVVACSVIFYHSWRTARENPSWRLKKE